MSDVNTQFALAAAAIKPVVAGVTSQQLDAATPCAQFTVRELMNHLFHAAIEMDKAARDQPKDLLATPDDHIASGWRDRYGEAVDRLAAAWAIPGAQDGTDPAMGLPKAVMTRMSLFDLIVHGWDLARATGQEYRPDPRLVDAGLEFMRENGEMGRRMGSFAEPVESEDTAPAIDQLIALSGRDPAWRP